MSSFFGKKAHDGKTVVLLDVESGSVGAALARLSESKQPRLLGEVRIPVRAPSSRSGEKLFAAVEHSAREALKHVATVAARLRNTPAPNLRGAADPAAIGRLERVAVLLHPPWAGIDFDSSGGARPGVVPEVIDLTRNLVEETFGTAPFSMHSFGASAAPLLYSLYGTSGGTLVCSVTGETTELVLVGEGGVTGHATLPLGARLLERTLTTHGGISPAEAGSVLALAGKAAPSYAAEPLAAAAAYFLEEFSEAAEALMAGRSVEHILILAPPRVDRWLAQSMTTYDLSSLFPAGGTVRTATAGHFTPHIAAHSPSPDVPLLIGALFIDARLTRV